MTNQIIETNAAEDSAHNPHIEIDSQMSLVELSFGLAMIVGLALQLRFIVPLISKATFEKLRVKEILQENGFTATGSTI